LIGHVNINGENFKISMKMLENRYENIEIIAEALMKRRFGMKDTMSR
jgi:hypothetical protein